MVLSCRCLRGRGALLAVVLALPSCREAELPCFDPTSGWTEQQVLQACGEPNEIVTAPFSSELESECSGEASRVLLFYSEGTTTALYIGPGDRVLCREFSGVFFAH